MLLCRVVARVTERNPAEVPVGARVKIAVVSVAAIGAMVAFPPEFLGGCQAVRREFE